MGGNASFELRCVGCKVVETRPAEDCRNNDGDPPMCNKCYMPMVLVSVAYRAGKKPKGPRTVLKYVKREDEHEDGGEDDQ
jgi:NAD-dependent SIR2 family protein deacetylase